MWGSGEYTPGDGEGAWLGSDPRSSGFFPGRREKSRTGRRRRGRGGDRRREAARPPFLSGRACCGLGRRLFPLLLEAAGQFPQKLQIDELRLRLVAGAPDPADAALRYSRANALLGDLAAGDPRLSRQGGRARVELCLTRTEPALYGRALLSPDGGRAGGPGPELRCEGPERAAGGAPGGPAAGRSRSRRPLWHWGGGMNQRAVRARRPGESIPFPGRDAGGATKKGGMNNGKAAPSYRSDGDGYGRRSHTMVDANTIIGTPHPDRRRDPDPGVPAVLRHCQRRRRFHHKNQKPGGGQPSAAAAGQAPGWSQAGSSSGGSVEAAAGGASSGHHGGPGREVVPEVVDKVTGIWEKQQEKRDSPAGCGGIRPLGKAPRISGRAAGAYWTHQTTR